MRLRRFIVVLGVVSVTGGGLGACGDSGAVSIDDPDASQPTTPPTTSPTTPPTPDAGDAAVVDGTADAPDSSVPDVTAPPPADGALPDATADAADAAAPDAADAAVPDVAVPPPVGGETVADLAGLTDFDFVGDHLVYRNPDFKHCTLPACADETAITAGPRMEEGFTTGDDGKLHYLTGWYDPPTSTRHLLGHVTIDFDNTGLAQTDIFVGGASSAFAYGYHGGQQNAVLVRTKPYPLGNMTFSYAYNLAGGGVNTSRVARATSQYHTNAGGAVAQYLPQGSNYGVVVPATFTGVSAPRPLTEPVQVAVSAKGAGVAYPTVAVVRNFGGAYHVEACPLATPCVAWKDLGTPGRTLNMDDTHLYVGTPTGLARCELKEIGTTGTCTLVARGPNEAVADPLYLTATHAWYRSGTKVRRVAK